MENTPHLYNTLVHVLGQHAKWADQRHLKTLAWMMVGIIHAGCISLSALVGWGEQTFYVALDTSMLWNTYCLIRLSVIYRGRAVPLVWCVLQHGSAQVAFEAYQELLTRAAVLIPRRCAVVLLADRDVTDRGREPGAILRAQAPLPPHQGRGAGGSLYRAVRARECPSAR